MSVYAFFLGLLPFPFLLPPPPFYAGAAAGKAFHPHITLPCKRREKVGEKKKGGPHSHPSPAFFQSPRGSLRVKTGAEAAEIR